MARIDLDGQGHLPGERLERVPLTGREQRSEAVRFALGLGGAPSAAARPGVCSPIRGCRKARAGAVLSHRERAPRFQRLPRLLEL